MSNIDITNWTSDYYINNRSACNIVLEDADVLQGIPSLNCLDLHNINDGQLVRFQGMIQDMYNPEYYFEDYEVKNTETGECYMRNGMYRDGIKCLSNEHFEIDSCKNKSSERQTCVLISVPGLNEWAKEKKPSSSSSSKINGHVTSCNGKRPIKDQNEPMDTADDDNEPAQKREKINDDKAEPGSSNSENKNPVIVSKDYLLNFPVPIDNGKACIVKIYQDTSTFKLNQVLNIVGFISLNPLLTVVHNSDELMDDIEAQTHNPPASLIPRLHAVKINLSSAQTILKSLEISSKAKMIHDDLHMVLSQLLFGDTLAADYLICHLISTVYTRKDYLCLGNFPLNITTFPEKFASFPKELYNFLMELVPKSHYFDCTLEALNDLSMVPKKDYDSNRLTSGMLQLSENTHLIIDETKLTSGQVSANGRLNYQAISNLIQFQKLTYDFKFYTIEYETDIPVLILSPVKSFIPCLIQVPLKIDPETENVYPSVVEAAKHYLSNEDRLSNIRQYLEFCRKAEFELGQDISDIIQDDFVELRKCDKAVNADNLHSLIVFARLMALSYGENSLTVERWKQAFTSENERVSRLPKLKK